MSFLFVVLAFWRSVSQNGVARRYKVDKAAIGPRADVTDDAALAAAFGRAGRARVERELKVDTMVTRTESLYDELLGRAG